MDGVPRGIGITSLDRVVATDVARSSRENSTPSASVTVMGQCCWSICL